MELELDSEETTILYRVVKNRIDELRGEIHHDHDSESRAYFKHKVAILNRILAKLPEGEVDAS